MKHRLIPSVHEWLPGLVRGEPCGSFGTAAAVFEATVLDITSADDRSPSEFGLRRAPQLVVRLAVHRSWKGVVANETTEVITNADRDDACGFDFEVGLRYVVFSERRGAGGRLEVSACGPTRAVGNAADALVFLASLSHPSVGGDVFGIVEPQPADADGRFEMRGLPPGTYRIRASWQDTPLPLVPDVIVIRDRPVTVDLTASVRRQPKT